MDVTKNDIDIYLSEVKESIRNNRYRIEQNPRRQDNANLFLDYIIDGLLKVDKLYMGALFPIYALVCIIIVFSVCSFLDIIRLRFIEPKMIGIFNRCEAIFVDNFLVE